MASVESLEALVKLLCEEYPSNASRRSTHRRLPDEQKKLDEVLIQYSQVYKFPEGIFQDLITNILENRLLNRHFLAKASREHQLRVLRVLRVLTRDLTLQQILIERAALETLGNLLARLKDELYADADHPYISDTIVEITSILKRISHLPESQKEIFDLGIHRALMSLLGARDGIILQSVLIVLVSLAPNPRSCQEAVACTCLESALRLFNEGGQETYRLLAAEYIDVLVEDPACRSEIQLLSGNSIFLSVLHAGQTDEGMILCALRCLSSMAVDPISAREIRELGGIPLLLCIISTGGDGTSLCLDSVSPVHALPSVPVCISVCIALTQLCLDDENAYLIRKNRGVYLLGQLFLEKDEDKKEVQAYALRSLRFLYSVQRNRKVFKKLFPPDFYSAFIDVGHYEHDMKPYQHLVKTFNDMPWSVKSSIIAAFDGLRTISTDGKRVLRGYIIQEVLGKGAFGTVYQVQKENGDKLYALKELPLKEGIMADAELTRSVADLCEEVEILSKLEHPNVVKYHASFVNENNLCIVMELVEGASLVDRLTDLQQKNQTMREDQIWAIFIQLCQALCYMHMEKRIVHRDLTPSNVMLDHKGVVKIADFGLARQKNGNSLMQSAVGTISYSCPEIVTHQAYTEKADIWSLGCILYQMTTLRPPFSGTNPLTVAQQIVAGDYEPIPADRYSPLLVSLIGKLLTVDQDQRPNILQVSSHVSPLLMAELDQVNTQNIRLRQQLEHEKAARKREQDEWNKQKQEIRAQVTMQQHTSAHAHLQDAQTPQKNQHQYVASAKLTTGNEDFKVPSPPPASSSRKQRRQSSRSRGRSLSSGYPSSPPSPGSRATTSSTQSPPSSALHSNRSTSRENSPPSLSRRISDNSTGSFPGSIPPLNLTRSNSNHSPSPTYRGTPLLRMNSSKLRSIVDPVESILGQVHKLIFVTQQPPTLDKDQRLSLLTKYKRALFSNKTSQLRLKQEIQNVLSSSRELTSVFQVRAPGDSKTLDNSSLVTCEDLHTMIEQLCIEYGYYDEADSSITTPPLSLPVKSSRNSNFAKTAGARQLHGVMKAPSLASSASAPVARLHCSLDSSSTQQFGVNDPLQSSSSSSSSSNLSSQRRRGRKFGCQGRSRSSSQTSSSPPPPGLTARGAPNSHPNQDAQYTASAIHRSLSGSGPGSSTIINSSTTTPDLPPVSIHGTASPLKLRRKFSNGRKGKPNKVHASPAKQKARVAPLSGSFKTPPIPPNERKKRADTAIKHPNAQTSTSQYSDTALISSPRATDGRNTRNSIRKLSLPYSDGDDSL